MQKENKESQESQESQESHEKKRHSDIATRKNYCSTKAININKNSSSVKGREIIDLFPLGAKKGTSEAKKEQANEGWGEKKGTG